MNATRATWPLLLATGIALSAWQWLAASDAPAPHGHHAHLHDDSGKPERLYTWNAAQAAQLRLATSDRVVTLTRGAQGWDASPPGNAQGFDAAAFLSLFSQARSERKLLPEAGEAYGLAPPQLRIEVRDAAGARLARLDVGALAPDGLGRYVQLPDEAQVRIIPDYQTRAPMAAMHQENPQAAATLSLVKPGLHKDK